jgi:hypothetical protein
MGVYYGCFNATKREWFTGHEMGQGAKWGETLYGNPAVALVVLLADDGRADARDSWRGRWSGDSVHVRSDAGLTWDEVIARLEGPDTRGLRKNATATWREVGHELHAYLLRRGELPCSTPLACDEPGDDEPACENCEWPMSAHGRLVGMALRK